MWNAETHRAEEEAASSGICIMDYPVIFDAWLAEASEEFASQASCVQRSLMTLHGHKRWMWKLYIRNYFSILYFTVHY